VVGAAGDVVGTATGVVGGAGRVSGDVAATAGDAVATTTRTLGDAGRVPRAVVDAAGATTATTAITIRAVDDRVADSVKQVPVPQAKVHVSEQAATDRPSAPVRPQRVVDKVDGIVHATAEDDPGAAQAVASTHVDNAVRATTGHSHTTGDVPATKKTSSRQAGDRDGGSDGSSSSAADHRVPDVATSTAHLLR